METKENSTEGYIYIIYNELFNHYGENVFKVGRASDVIKRLHEYNTSYISPSELKFVSVSCKNVILAEQIVFSKLSDHRLVKNREFFNIALHIAIGITETSVSDINNGIMGSLPASTKK